MAQIINVNFTRVETEHSSTIDMDAITRYNAKLKAGMIQPAAEEVTEELAPEHASEPIKDMKDVDRISKYLIQNGRFRDNMLFIVGINFGLRVSDLLMLRFSNVINEDCTFKRSFPVFEKKTRNTRKKKRNRWISINMAVIEAVTLYLENTPNVKLSDYMFRSEASNATGENKPISRIAVYNMLQNLKNDLGLEMRVSTHTLRKTFAYHQMMMSHNDPRKLLLLQKMMGHSSVAQTLDYIGITNEEMEAAYLGMNLGSDNYNYLIDSTVGETVEEVC